MDKEAEEGRNPLGEECQHRQRPSPCWNVLLTGGCFKECSTEACGVRNLRHQCFLMNSGLDFGQGRRRKESACRQFTWMAKRYPIIDHGALRLQKKRPNLFIGRLRIEKLTNKYYLHNHDNIKIQTRIMVNNPNPIEARDEETSCNM